MNILIVEDRLDDRTLLRCILQSNKDWRIAEAGNGREALDHLAKAPVDLVITDVLMPTMDGFSLLRAIRQDPGLAATPVIFYTASYSGEKEEQLALAMGADAMLVKPMQPSAIVETITRLMRELPGKPRPTPLADFDQEQELLLKQYSIQVNTKLETKVKELELTKDTWEKTFNSLQEIVTVQDRHMRILRANAEAGRCFKTEVTELIGRSCHEVFRGSAQPCASCPSLETYRDKQSHTSVIRHDALGKIFQVTSTPVLDQNQELEYLIHVARDITEESRLAEKLRQAHKMEAIGTLAGGIAHDFNNILAAILGYAELAQLKANTGQSPEIYLKEIITASLRAKDLVRQILTFSRKGTGHQANGPMAPYPLVKEALKFLRSSLPSSIIIKEELDPACGAVLAEPADINQLVVNLCTNAFQSMGEEKGTLTVSMQRRDLDAVFLADHPGLPSGPYLILTVQDSGAGIAAEDLSRIFEPYYTTKSNNKGLGLAEVHSIVRDLGGTISVQSALGHGSTFTVLLPALPKEIQRTRGALDNLRSGTERIMVVDDDKSITALLGGMLGRLGYRVTIHTDSVQALSTFRRDPDGIDLLITDQTMPGLTGAELTQEMHRLRPSLPVILCTGFSSVLSEEQAKAMGIQQYLNKPIGLQELTQAMGQLLD